MNFEDASAALERALDARPGIVEQFTKGGAKGAPFARLRSAMRSHTFQTGDGTLSLQKVVFDLDERSQREGLHVLHAWDFQRHVFSEDIAPVLLLDHCAELRRGADDRLASAILLDVYLYTMLSLLAVRAWDSGDPNANLDRVNALMRVAQQGGSGLAYVDDAETLLFLAISYYHPQEDCYGRLLEKVRALDASHRLSVAVPCGAMLSAHLRWGFRFMYERDVGRMREDNVVDYPWLTFAVETLEQAYERSRSPESAEALLLAVAADPWSYVLQLNSEPTEIARAFLELQPAFKSYSPLAFTCNFPSNAAVALVAASIEDGRVYPSLNTLFRRETSSAATAERLMKYSASDPSRLGHGGAPLVIHDPSDGVRAWNAVMRELPGPAWS